MRMLRAAARYLDGMEKADKSQDASFGHLACCCTKHAVSIEKS